MQRRYHTLDVFTTTRFAGNPLAVFTDGDELSDDQMLAIAREMNLSETVFVQKPTDEEALARLRIFTTKDRKSTRLNSSHGYISYAVFCLKKKKKTKTNNHAPDEVITTQL